MLRRRRLTRAPRTFPTLNLTPLIDVALTLLVIFMVTTPLVQHAIKVELPHGQMNEAQPTKPDECIVYINKEGHCFLNKERCQLDKLIVALEERTSRDAETVVFVHADEAVDYGTVIEVVDKIKYVGGIKYVALATQKAH